VLAGAFIALAALAAYANTFSAPFFFDDVPGITQNTTIRHLGQIGPVLSPPANDGSSVSGRPMVNLSLAINYAISGLNVWSYHAANLLIHILAALTLFGIVRRTLQKVGTGGRPVRAQPETRMELTDGRAARPYLIAFAVALLWAVHPLLTESVTCVIQRTESLMALFYLLTLYCFIRGTEGDSGVLSSFAPQRGASADEKAARHASLAWLGLGWLACLFGVASKEVMVTAPVIVFLYDRTFVAGTFREAWRRRRWFYLALGATWLLLAALLLHSGGSRGIAAGFGLGVTPWQYALTQCQAIILYLKLSVWPHSLLIDYGGYVAGRVGMVWPQALLLAALLAVVVWALVRRPALGFLGAWFFVILAPSSSVVPLVTQTIAEHRMYLPLAAVVMLGVLGLQAMFPRRLLPVSFVLAAGLGALTVRRNQVYRSTVAIWSDAVAKAPENARAFNNLGTALDSAGDTPRATVQYRAALQLWPGYAEAHNNLGNDLRLAGRLAEAVDEFSAAVWFKPAFAEAYYNQANTLVQLGRLPDAIGSYRKALQNKAEYFEAHGNLGLALFDAGQVPQAIMEYEEALRINPDYVVAHYDLGSALAQTGHLPEAVQQFEAALRLDPGYVKAQSNLGNTLFQMGRYPEAIGHYESALRLQPNNPRTHYNLGNALLQLGRVGEARTHYEAALRLKPDFPEARAILDRLPATPAPASVPATGAGPDANAGTAANAGTGANAGTNP
jgi:tetratricopeptide (TPR) repeat protein